jgi:hypothetical protein
MQTNRIFGKQHQLLASERDRQKFIKVYWRNIYGG